MKLLRMIALLGCVGLQLSGSLSAQVRDASIPDLIKQLDDKEIENKRDAVYELVRRRDSSLEVLTALSNLVEDKDAQVRVQALTGIARAGKQAEPVIPQLIKCLSSRDDQVRYRAAAALGEIGVASIEPIVSQWSKASSEYKVAAAQALASIGVEAASTKDLLVEALADKDPVPRYAAEALVAIVPSDEATILKVAENENPLARKIGVSGLASLASPSDAAIERIKKAVGDSDSKIRETAVIAVAKSRLPANDKVQIIESALLDEDASVRAAAVAATRRAKLPASEFAQRIAGELPTASDQAALALVKAIGAIGPEASPVLPVLLQQIDRSGMDRQQLSQAIARLGSANVPNLLIAIERNPSQEPVIAQSLALIGEPAVPALVEGMKSDVELIRVAATRALGGVRPFNKRLGEQLVGRLSDSSPQVRLIATEALVAIGDEADYAKEDLLKATSDEAVAVRSAAIKALAVFKFNEDQMQASLQKGLQDEAARGRVATIDVLISMPKLIKSRLDNLIALAKDEDASVRTKALQAISKLDKKQLDERVVNVCIESLSDSERTVQLAATEAVTALEITDGRALESLAANLTDDTELLRATLNAIAKFGDKGASVIETVSSIASHGEPSLRVVALQTLASIQRDLVQLTGQLTAALSDKEWEVRRAASNALGKLGPDAKHAVPKLFELMASEEDREFAGAALKEINTAPVEAVPLLIEKLNSEDRRTAFFAISMLGKIGPPAAEALPALEALRDAPGGDPGRAEFRKKTLAEAIALIKGEKEPKKDK